MLLADFRAASRIPLHNSVHNVFRALTAVCILVDNLLNCFCSAGAFTSDVCYAEDLREALSQFLLLLLLFSGKNTTNYYLQTLIAEDYFLIYLFKGFLCCLCSHLQSSTGDLCLIKKRLSFDTLHSPSTASLLSPCFSRWGEATRRLHFTLSPGSPRHRVPCGAMAGTRRHPKPLDGASAGPGLVAARPAGCEGPGINRGSW